MINFKKMVALVLGAIMVLSMVACGDNAKPQTPNPFVTCADLDEAAEITGFSLTAPDGYTAVQVMNQSMIQAQYDKDGADMQIRKATGDEDISGDYTEYKQVETVEDVTIKGENDAYSLAIWAKDGYTYCISVGKPISQTDMLAMISTIE